MLVAIWASIVAVIVALSLAAVILSLSLAAMLPTFGDTLSDTTCGKGRVVAILVNTTLLVDGQLQWDASCA